MDFAFDPSVASFFADDDRGAAKEGVIFCVDTADLDELMKGFVYDDIHAAKFIKIDVSNLWRLQAQQGLFLETHCRLDRFYPLDRIIFPHTTVKSPVERRLIYPEYASHLEAAVNEFFRFERIEISHQELTRSIVIPRFTLKVNMEEELEKTAQISEWHYELKWHTAPDEKWRDALKTIDIPAPNLSSALFLTDDLSDIVLDRHSQLRLCTLSDAPHLQDAIDLVWNGMRRLPFSPEQITAALKRTVQLKLVLATIELWNWAAVVAAVSPILGQNIEIEMGLRNGAWTRALVSRSAFMETIKPDVVAEFVRMNECSQDETLNFILLDLFASPHRIFDGEKLIDLFAEQIIPWQVANDRPFVVFSPTRLETLGRP